MVAVVERDGEETVGRGMWWSVCVCVSGEGEDVEVSVWAEGGLDVGGGGGFDSRSLGLMWWQTMVGFLVGGMV